MSSSDLAVSIRGISKAYRIAPSGEQPSTLREAIVQKLRNPFSRAATETFWALQGISLDIHAGEVVGLIGRNGAGKSTLLKVLSRITRPTAGRVRLHGRVGSLLEAGAGFHSELTGRENVYLNGVILGMKRREIDRQFDAIVEFAGIGPFLDVPVKRYSSGMYVRLAFAVAAHLQPEILLVDEVLAVGDADFQKKCLGTMHDVAESGRTVVFVSHNMSAVTRLCERVVLLSDGRIAYDGPARETVEYYLRSGMATTAECAWNDGRKAPGNDVVRLRRVRVCAADGETASTIDVRRPVGIEIDFDVLQDGQMLAPSLDFTNEYGSLMFTAHDTDPDWRRRPRPAGHYTSTAWIPANLLAEGNTLVSVKITNLTPALVHAEATEVVAFQVVDSMEGDSARGDYVGPIYGAVRPLLDWRTEFTPARRNGVVVAGARRGG
ncbi:MAG TPA: polysaccharide ABC transporter ATP-binding protein [Dehalococcoidia bacterium]|nr:polysaccharide ABC transporter ATP-binding protein [Dehalococcoidia bacterium]